MKPAVVMQTDFSRDESVAAMYGVVESICPEVNVFDCDHSIPPFNIWAASTSLEYVVGFWPAGTVFVSVVDPGVGTDRKGCVALLENGVYIVTPDNGALTHVARYIGVKAVREIDMSVNRLPQTKSCNIFHGRDVFAYTAGRLAGGVIDFAGVGPEYPVDDIIRIPYDEPAYENGTFTGIIQSAHPHFGLISTNIPEADFTAKGAKYGDFFDVHITHKGETVFHEKVEYQRSFGYVKKGDPILYIGSQMVMEITLHSQNMVKKYGISAGPDWRMTIARA